MKLVAAIKLLPTDEQRSLLLATLTRCSAAASWLAGEAFHAQCADKYTLHARHYRELRERFGLSAQMAVRVIAKVCGAYKRDRSIQPVFRDRGSAEYDARLYTMRERTVTLTTLEGRIEVPWICGDHQRALLGGKRGQAHLVLRKGRWYLYVSVEATEAPTNESPAGWLGVDLGVCNLAVDSDGAFHTGADVERVRQRYQTQRDALQSCGTRSARRHLKKLSGREARFRSDTNHRVSKALVEKAQGTCRGLALEDLKGIRDRVTVARRQRARHSGWSFYQLRFFVEYKARRVGVPVRLVDPRNTSRTCPACGFCSWNNRRSQAVFRCHRCDFVAHADVVGATNIATRAAANQPIVSSADRVNTGARGPIPRGSSDASPIVHDGVS